MHAVFWGEHILLSFRDSQGIEERKKERERENGKKK